MPRGQPDFGMYAVKDATVSISDMGEVAARLGSIVIFDKRGDVVDFDNFEEPVLKAKYTDRDYPFGVHLTNEAARSGCQSVRMRPRDIIEDTAFFQKFATPLATSKLGVEVSFTAPLQHAYVYAGIVLYTPAAEKTACILLDTRLRNLYYYNEEGDPILIGSFTNIHPLRYLFYTLKLVVNFDTNKYARCLFSNQEWDLSAHSIQVTPRELVPYFTYCLTFENQTTSENVIYVDDFILTQAEP